MLAVVAVFDDNCCRRRSIFEGSAFSFVQNIQSNAYLYQSKTKTTINMELYITLSIVAIFLIVLGGIYLLIQRFLQREEEMRYLELRKMNQQIATPARLQAYERLALFLERIHPKSLIIRMHPQENISAMEYKNVLQQSVQQEFDHNISQQIYVSRELWETIEAAKNQVVLELAELSKGMPPQTPSPAFFQMMQAKLDEEHEEAVEWIADMALVQIRTEVAKQF